MVVDTPVILELRRQRQLGLCECGLHRRFQARQEYIVRPCLSFFLKRKRIPRLALQFVKCFVHKCEGPELGL